MHCIREIDFTTISKQQVQYNFYELSNKSDLQFWNILSNKSKPVCLHSDPCNVQLWQWIMFMWEHMFDSVISNQLCSLLQHYCISVENASRFILRKSVSKHVPSEPDITHRVWISLPDFKVSIELHCQRFSTALASFYPCSSKDF